MTLPSAATSRLVCGSDYRRDRSSSRGRSHNRSWSRGLSWSRGSKAQKLFDLPSSEDEQDEWKDSHIGEISKEPYEVNGAKKPTKIRPPEINTNVQTEVSGVSSSGSESKHKRIAPARHATAPISATERETDSIGDNSIDHLVAYYVDQIPSLTNLCWHLFETKGGDKRKVHVPARICAVKKASQQAMIDDLGFLKGGRFLVVPTSELIRYSGASQKKKWCSKYMMEYLEYISHFYTANDVKEEEVFLKKVLKAVKKKDLAEVVDARDDDGSEKSDEYEFINQMRKDVPANVHTTKQSVYMDEREQAPEDNYNFAQFPVSPSKIPTPVHKEYSYESTKQVYSADKHDTKREARVKFNMNDERPDVDMGGTPEKTVIREVTEQLHQMQMNTDSNSEKKGLDADTWEIVLRGTKLSRGATPLVNRCMRSYGWSEEYAIRVLKGYKQFCAWKQTFEDWDDTALAPPVPIRQMWLQHLLDSHHYQIHCLTLFGHILHYSPDNGADTAVERERIENTKRIALVHFRGKDYDKDVWTWESQQLDIGFDSRPQHHPGREVTVNMKPILLQHSRSSDDGVPQSMREALALVQQARRGLKSAPRTSRPYSLQIQPSTSVSSDVSSSSSNNVIRLRLVGNGRNGLRSASIVMDYCGSFTKPFEEYASEYAKRVGHPRVHLRFLTKDGRRIGDHDSPKSLLLLNNDEIIVVQPESPIRRGYKKDQK